VLQAGAPDDVVERARQIHDAIRSTPLHLDRRTIAMTASIGVAHGRTGEVDLDGLYAAADRALYRAKDDGRDGLRVASDAEVAPLRS
jgi:diguanylate cyclase (GGDEF)-like protein